MNCLEAGALLEALHDGALDFETSKSVGEHVSVCPACGAELARLRQLSGLLGLVHTPIPSAELDDGLAWAFRQKHRRPQPRPRRIFGFSVSAGSVNVPVPALALCAVAVVAALAAALRVGMLVSTPLIVEEPRTVADAISHPLPAPTEQAGVVEVPLVRERSRTVRVGLKRDDSRRRRDKSKTRTGTDDPGTKALVGENGYFTLANLSGFVPSGEMRARVVGEVKVDEK